MLFPFFQKLFAFCSVPFEFELRLVSFFSGFGFFFVVFPTQPKDRRNLFSLMRVDFPHKDVPFELPPVIPLSNFQFFCLAFPVYFSAE